MVFHSVAWVLWWTRYLASRWKYLSVSGRSIRDIVCNPASKLPKCEQRFVRVDGILRDIWLSRSLQEKQINREFLEFHVEWCEKVRKFTATQARINTRFKIWAGKYEELCDTAFWLYASLIFLLNVVWFLVRILKYKTGGIQLPTTGPWRKRKDCNKRYYRVRDFKRWRYKKRYSNTPTIKRSHNMPN